MASRRRQFCSVCGGHIDVVGSLSARGICLECGIGRSTSQQWQMAGHSGEEFEHWRRRVAASVGAVLPEDMEQKP